MTVKGKAFGKYKPCKWCGSKATYIFSSTRFGCSDCGRTTGRFSDRNVEITEEQKMKRPWCIKCRKPMWKYMKVHFRCTFCGGAIYQLTEEAIRRKNLKAMVRPPCPYCGTQNPHKHKHNWKCVNPLCRSEYPVEGTQKEVYPPQPIREVII